jgi:hypothetical protein
MRSTIQHTLPHSVRSGCAARARHSRYNCCERRGNICQSCCSAGQRPGFSDAALWWASSTHPRDVLVGVANDVQHRRELLQRHWKLLHARQQRADTGCARDASADAATARSQT